MLQKGDRIITIQNGHLNSALVGKTGVITEADSDWYYTVLKTNSSLKTYPVYTIKLDDNTPPFVIVDSCVRLLEPKIDPDPDLSERIKFWEKIL